ncbi:unnamed protein product [Soboliphyme baturini]|uniref:TIL domain-containing protein n=1 Tax=Soboliphyme baturini TaxID=241478 RepID=A0A183JB86_9BILA|nr:unnamed protein product [Soboliphyme baturini]
MSSIFSYVFCFDVLYCTLTPNSAKCKENEVFNECGSACEPTCESIKSNLPVACPLICIAKCVCKEGFVLNSKGECIPTCNFDERLNFNAVTICFIRHRKTTMKQEGRRDI